MTHNTRTQPDATWTTGNYVVQASDWTDLDRKVFQAINGDRGGTWAPSSQLILSGASAAISMSPVVVDYGGSLTLSSSAQVNVAGASGGWPALGPGHSGQLRTIMHSWLERQTTPLYHWENNIALGGVQSIACTVQSNALLVKYAITGGKYNPQNAKDGPVFSAGASTLQQPRMMLALRVHDGGRIASVTITFIVAGPRQAAPVVAPRLRVIRSDLSGTVVPLASTATGADAQGFRLISSASSGAAWYAGGAVQTFTYACDQNNVVDVSQYLYYAELIEEVGTLVPLATTAADGTIVRERKASVAAASTANVATLSGPQTIDGIALSNNPVLLKDQTDPTTNGIYLVPSSATAWTRLYGLSTPADFTPGFIVSVNAGNINANTIWECSTPTSAQAITLAAGSGTPINFQRRQPRGNTYLSAAVNHDSITDMRWQ